MARKTKILVISHGHPDNSKGGGEVAAYNLHNKLNTTDDYHSVFFARHARDELVHPGTLLSGSGRPDEILIHSTRNDYFLHSQHNKVLVAREFRQTLEKVNPDIVHFHHYIHLGLELIREARSFNPDVKIILTLHEYIAICNNNGQMMTTSNTLCHSSSPQTCVKCYPQHVPQDFLMRKLFFKSHFDLVDTFISPSHFLKQRYVDWGIKSDDIHVIDNMLDDQKYGSDIAAQQHDAPNTNKVRFSYYGQINWFKGLDVLLTAISKLPDEIREKMQLDINGSGLEQQPAELQKNIERLLGKLKDVVNLCGPYTQHELSSLMNNSEWMIVPSKWWENSPMVILEARKHGLPVICGDIGGMAEKVEHGVTGMHYQTGRADSLADAITRAVEHPHLQTEYASAMKDSYRSNDAFNRHTSLYSELLETDAPIRKAVADPTSNSTCSEHKLNYMPKAKRVA